MFFESLYFSMAKSDFTRSFDFYNFVIISFYRKVGKVSFYSWDYIDSGFKNK